MSSRYKVHENYAPHFVTSTVVGWVDALSREMYKEIICKSLLHCMDKKGLVLHAWVIMPNHIHLIISCADDNSMGGIMRDFKKYTSRQIIKAIDENAQESRKKWMLNLLRFIGETSNSNEEYQFWQHDYHPIVLDTTEKLNQRMNYLHENPVRAGIVWQPEEYKYSSATDYHTNKKGLLPIIRLD